MVQGIWWFRWIQGKLHFVAFDLLLSHVGKLLSRTPTAAEHRHESAPGESTANNAVYLSHDYASSEPRRSISPGVALDGMHNAISPGNLQNPSTEAQERALAALAIGVRAVVHVQTAS
jgi:hypothetical protein